MLRREDFESCPFVNILLESGPGSLVDSAASDQLRKIRAILRKPAAEAGFTDLERFTRLWHMLMQDSIVCAEEDNRNAARPGTCPLKRALPPAPPPISGARSG